MKTTPSAIASFHLNVMELLVQEEIERQIRFYPKALKSYLNTVEVATYALNRLPPLYASCIAGKDQQLRLGRSQYKNEIIGAVRRALAAIERDPLRISQPIVTEKEVNFQKADSARLAVEKLLQDHQLLDGSELSWENLAAAIQRAINKVAWRVHPTESELEQGVPVQTPVQEPVKESFKAHSQEDFRDDLDDDDAWFSARSRYLI